MKEKLLTLGGVTLIVLLAVAAHGEDTASTLRLAAASQDLETSDERVGAEAVTGVPGKPGRPALTSCGLSRQATRLSLFAGGGPDFGTAEAPVTLNQQSPVNCSIWPSNCSCVCIQSCYAQYLECTEHCAPWDIMCRLPCDLADDCCVDQCCGYQCQFG